MQKKFLLAYILLQISYMVLGGVPTTAMMFDEDSRQLEVRARIASCPNRGDIQHCHACSWRKGYDEHGRKCEYCACNKQEKKYKCSGCKLLDQSLDAMQKEYSAMKERQRIADARASQEAELKQKALSEAVAQASNKSRLEQLAIQEAELRVKLLQAQLAAINTGGNTGAEGKK